MKIKYYFLGSIVGLILYATSIAHSDIISDGNDVVAVINGKTVSESDIEPSSEKLASILLNSKIEKLYHIVKKNVIEHAILNYGIQISDTEVKVAVQKRFKKGGMNNSKFQDMQDKLNRLTVALEQWQQKPNDEDKIYRNLLSRDIPLTQWKLWTKYYSTPDKLIALQKQTPDSLEQMQDNTMESCRQDILNQKLMLCVIGDIKISDNDILDFQKRYHHEYNTTTLLTKEDLYNKVLHKKQQTLFQRWLHEKIITAPIDFRSTLLRKAWKEKYISSNQINTKKTKPINIPSGPSKANQGQGKSGSGIDN